MDLDSTSLVSSQSSHGQFNSLFSSSVPSRMTAAISLILPMLVPMLAPMGGTLPRVASRSDQEGGTNGPKRAGHVDRRLEPHERGGGDATMYQAGLGVSQDGNRFFRALTYSYLVRDPTSCKLRWACLGMERKSYIYMIYIYIYCFMLRKPTLKDTSAAADSSTSHRLIGGAPNTNVRV